MKLRSQRLFAVSFLFLFVACSQQSLRRPDSTSEIKNIIFLIGDGMGIPQINAARMSSAGAAGSLHIDTFPVVGLLKTHAVDGLITDSAAAGTALACGVKTQNGVIALDAEGRRVQTILEAAQKMGKATGLIATSSITHATPAVFAAHIDARHKEPEIAKQMLETRVNVLLGGGRCYFVPRSTEDSCRKDNSDLIAAARRMGYAIPETREDLFDGESNYVLGLFEMGALSQKPQPTLAEMTRAAIQILKQNRNGFFLMVEGSQIDWRSHDNDAEGTITQMLQFDAAIEVALDFAKKEGRTLVVVTADHETGGMTITDGDVAGESLEVKWTTLGHTGVDIPIFAYGPGADRFSGVYQNTEVPKKMAKLLGIAPFPNVIE